MLSAAIARNINDAGKARLMTRRYRVTSASTAGGAVEHHRHVAAEDRPRLEADAARDRRVDCRIGGEAAQASARPADALPLPSRELLEQSPDDDGLVPGLEVDGIDRDLVEVPA